MIIAGPIRLLSRNACLQSRIITLRCFSDKDDSSDDEKKIKKFKEKHNANKLNHSAVDRLNKLLASMPTDNNFNFLKKVEVPKAGLKKVKLKEQKNKEQNIENSKDLQKAAEMVANSIGGDVKKIESELLSKLLSHNEPGAGENTENGDKTFVNLNDLIVGMKIDRTKKTTDGPDSAMSKSQYVRRTYNQNTSGNRYERDASQRREKRPRPETKAIQISGGSVNLFDSEPLNIFKSINNLQASPDICSTWAALEERELKLAVTSPPSNFFEKMILWTDQGKLWKFPIDNEQGMDEEAKVYFADHIFLEQLLEGWCPTKGPIRHFMELVCIGLSKNPYITVKDKKDHIDWYRDYFEQKKEIIKQTIQEIPIIEDVKRSEH